MSSNTDSPEREGEDRIACTAMRGRRHRCSAYSHGLMAKPNPTK